MDGIFDFRNKTFLNSLVNASTKSIEPGFVFINHSQKNILCLLLQFVNVKSNTTFNWLNQTAKPYDLAIQKVRLVPSFLMPLKLENSVE